MLLILSSGNFLFLKSSTSCYKLLLKYYLTEDTKQKRGFWKQMKSSLMEIKTLIIKIAEDPAGCLFFPSGFELL